MRSSQETITTDGISDTRETGFVDKNVRYGRKGTMVIVQYEENNNEWCEGSVNSELGGRGGLRITQASPDSGPRDTKTAPGIQRPFASASTEWLDHFQGTAENSEDIDVVSRYRYSDIAS